MSSSSTTSSYFTGRTSAAAGVCGQASPLTTQLRGIISDYSGQQLLNELLQNADDAGATEFAVCFDKRQHATETLLSPAMAEFQGPAILQYDNATFKDSDFESIQRLGDGLKHGDPTKTGQFGLGFNSCYHITDLPSFISGNFLVLFDPHKKYLPVITSCRETGLFYSLRRKSVQLNDIYTVDEYPDQFKPFLGAFGCDGKGNWHLGNDNMTAEGTLFRFPLRTTGVAKASEISQKASANDLDSVYREIIEPFVDNMSHRLLFMKSIQKITIFTHERDEVSMRIVAFCEVKHMADADKVKRKSLHTMMKDALEAQSSHSRTDPLCFVGQSNFELQEKRYERHLAMLQWIRQNPRAVCRPTFPLVVHSSLYEISGQSRVSVLELLENFIVAQNFGDENDLEFAHSSDVQSQKLFFIPYAAVAARISSFSRQVQLQLPPTAVIPQFLSVANDIINCVQNQIQSSQMASMRSRIVSVEFKQQTQALRGTVFCCLPTLMASGLPVHIDARWELTRSRNNFSGSFQHVQATSTPGVTSSALSSSVGRLKAEWNSRLACRVAAAAYARLLQILVNHRLENVFFGAEAIPATALLNAGTAGCLDLDVYYGLFPSAHTGALTEPWTGLLATLYGMIGCTAHPLWKNYQYETNAVAPGSEIKFLRRCAALDPVEMVPKAPTLYSAQSAIFFSAESLVSAGRYEYLIPVVHCLLGHECPITDAPVFILEALELYSDGIAGRLCPSSARHWIKSYCDKPDNYRRWREAVQWNEETATTLCQYLLEDLQTVTTEFLSAELKDLPFIPVYRSPDGAETEIRVHVIKPSNEYKICRTPSNSQGRRLFEMLAATKNLVLRVPSRSTMFLMVESSALVLPTSIANAVNISPLDLLWVASLIIDISPWLELESKSTETRQQETFLLLLWNFIEQQIQNCVAQNDQPARARLMAALEELRYVPLIPCMSPPSLHGGGRAEQQISVTILENLRTVMPAPSSGNSRFQFEMAPSAETVIVDLLCQLRVPLLHSAFAKSIVRCFDLLKCEGQWKCAQFTAPDIVFILAKVSPTAWDAVPDAHRCGVLEFVSAWTSGRQVHDPCTGETLRLVSQLPVFRREPSIDSSSYSSVWTSLVLREGSTDRMAAWFTLPQFEEAKFRCSSSYPYFLALPSSSYVSLYAMLNINPLPVEQFYISFVLPAEHWRTLSLAEHTSHLRHIRSVFDQVGKNKIVLMGVTTTMNLGSLKLKLRQDYGFVDDDNGQPWKVNIGNICFGEILSRLAIFKIETLVSKAHSVAATVSTTWLSARQLVDRRVPLLAHFFPQRLEPAHLSMKPSGRTMTPSDSNDVNEWSRFLIQLGMSERVTPGIIMQCATAVDMSYRDVYERLNNNERTIQIPARPKQDRQMLLDEMGSVVKSSRVLVTHILSNLEDIQFQLAWSSAATVETSNIAAVAGEWFTTIGSLFLAEAYSSVPEGSNIHAKSSGPKRLIPFQGALFRPGCCEQLFHCAWSQRYVLGEYELGTGAAVSSVQLSFLGVSEFPTLSDAVNHLVFMSTLPAPQLKIVQDCFSRSAQFSMTGNSLHKQLDCVYMCLQKYSSYDDSISEAVSDADSSKSFIRDKLSGVACILLRPSTTLVNATFQDPERDTYTFVRPDQLFWRLQDDIVPFAYTIGRAPQSLLYNNGNSQHSSKQPTSSGSLASVFQIREYPSIDDVTMWFQVIAAENASRPIDDATLQTVINLSQLVCFLRTSSDSLVGGSEIDLDLIYLPDTKGFLHPISRALYLDDAPWLRGRLDELKFALIHPSVPNSVAVGLGVRLLSQSVVEKVDTQRIQLFSSSTASNSIEAGAVGCVNRWNNSLHQPAYMGALRKAVQSYYRKSDIVAGRSMPPLNAKMPRPRLRSDSHPGIGILPEEEAIHKVFSLSRCEIKLARQIHTRLMLYSTHSLLSNIPPLDVTLSSVGSEVVLVTDGEVNVGQHQVTGGSITIYVLLCPLPQDLEASNEALYHKWKKRR
jgi:hypothetical protein